MQVGPPAWRNTDVANPTCAACDSARRAIVFSSPLNSSPCIPLLINSALHQFPVPPPCTQDTSQLQEVEPNLTVGSQVMVAKGTRRGACFWDIHAMNLYFLSHFAIRPTRVQASPKLLASMLMRCNSAPPKSTSRLGTGPGGPQHPQEAP